EEHAPPAPAPPEPAPPTAGVAKEEDVPPPIAAEAPPPPPDPEPERASEPSASEVKREVVPDVPQRARDTIRGRLKLTVRVQVDPGGEVSAAELDSPSPSKYFSDLALNAARRWKFSQADAGIREW